MLGLDARPDALQRAHTGENERDEAQAARPAADSFTRRAFTRGDEVGLAGRGELSPRRIFDLPRLAGEVLPVRRGREKVLRPANAGQPTCSPSVCRSA